MSLFQPANTMDQPRKLLFGLIIFRIFTITVLMGSTTFLNYRSGQSWSAVQQLTVYSIGVIYLLSIFYLLALQYNTSYRFQAITQIFVDVLFWSCLVYITGGLYSPITFIYALTIIQGALLLGGRGAVITCCLSVLLFFFVVLFEAHGIYHSVLDLRPSFEDPFALKQLYQIFLNVCMFVLIAVLASYLAREVSTREEKLTKERMSLKVQKMLNRSIIRGMRTGFLMTDPDGKLTFLNMAAERLFSISHEEVLDQPMDFVVPILKPYMQLEIAKKEWARQIELKLSDNPEDNRWISFAFSDVVGLNGDKVGTIVIADEITERRLLENRVFQNQKLAAIGELAAGIAHEIRNPLASISGSIQMLKSEFPPGDDNEKLMEIILRETDRLNSLINDFLSYARPKPLNIAAINIREIIEDILQLLSQTSGLSRIRIRVEYYDNMPELYGDAGQIRQMLWNVIKNSAEAASGRSTGVVWITIGKGPETEEGLPTIQFVISDNGKGMEKETLEQIFHPFFTTKPGGTGLGMSIMHQVVQGHNGIVEVDSTVEKGTRFTITIPTDSLRKQTVAV